MPIVLLVVAVAVWYWWPSDKVVRASASYDAGYEEGVEDTCRAVISAVPNVRDELRRRRIC